ncbi:MAG: hypothetical protein GF418_04625, partial [Chitinivibrionales bacterium]|nr:hypothetical protein [Chitinivibrionales bacterium]MBD3394893.1 hypothetical protein [Chitinivibrionales bacterium]
MHAGRYALLDDGSFVVKDFQSAIPFSNFFNGVAGLWGIPLWLFYVNRGQAVACFGVQDRDNAILEFQSFGLHLRRVRLEGFRTFLKVRREGRKSSGFYEPFGDPARPNRLVHTDHDLTIEETCDEHGLLVRVRYFAIPGEPFAALSRTVTIENIADTGVRCEMLDGLPAVVPHGLDHRHLKDMPFVGEAFALVDFLENSVPLFRLKTPVTDISEIVFVQGGHFYAAAGGPGGERSPLDIVVDPRLVFGDAQDHVAPRAFLACDRYHVPSVQDTVCLTPCAFSHARTAVPAGGRAVIQSIIGHAPDRATAGIAAAHARDTAFIERKHAENALESARIKDRFFVHSGNRMIDRYIQQSFLDNVLRGGLPLTVGAGSRKKVYHVYARKHGDLERDYNFFRLEPTFFSQGNGNYRDVNQNRRNDVWINPDTGSDTLKYFFNLIQPDGYNPLHCEGVEYQADTSAAHAAAGCAAEKHRDKLLAFFQKPFTPGSLFAFCRKAGIELAVSREEFLARVLSAARSLERASFGEGYWTDHWFYCFDLLESYLAIYPDRLCEVLLEDDSFTYWDTDRYVKPRDARFVLKEGVGIRALDPLGIDGRKTELIASRTRAARLVRTEGGLGDVYQCNLMGKIVCLLLNKIATLSPSGIGVEMEAGRPGWCDSVNGLPSVLGAGTPEAYQIVRAIRRVRDLIAQAGARDRTQRLPSETGAFFASISDALNTRLAASGEQPDFEYWEAANAAKEEYRMRVHLGFDGAEMEIRMEDILELFDAAEQRIMTSLERAVLENGLPATYVTHEPIDYTLLTGMDHETGMSVPVQNARGYQCVRIHGVRAHLFAPFLEGCAHSLAVQTDRGKAAALCDTVRRSELYDASLGMYKVNACVGDETPEQGRTAVFPRGWLENESVFMHMQFKFLLQLFRAGLYERFFEDIRRCWPPFLDPGVYGRSPLENVSFIATAAHPRERFHGRGVQPRMSGSNAEMVEMALHMCFGPRPFVMSKGVP